MTYSSEVLADSPQGFWLLDETSGTSAADSSGNSRPMTYAAGAALNGPVLYNGGGSSVKGSNGAVPGAVGIANAAWMNNIAGYTVGGWVAPTTDGDIQGLFNRYIEGTGGWVCWQRSGKLSLVSVTSGNQRESAGTPIAVNKPQHLMVRVTGTLIELFQNGVLTSSHSAFSALPTNAPLGIGNYGTAGFSFARFSGFAYYNTALSNARIAAHYAAGAIAHNPLPTAHWKLDETSGTSMADSSGNGFAGTYSGAILNQAPLRGTGAAAKGGTTGQGVASVPAAAGSAFDTGEFTVAATIKPANTGSPLGLISRWLSSRGWIFWQYNGTLNLYLESNLGNANYMGPPIDSGVAKRYTLTVAAGVAKLYINSSISYTWNTTIALPASATAIQIGGYASSNFSQAVYDDIKYWDYALTEAEVVAEMPEVVPKAQVEAVMAEVLQVPANPTSQVEVVGAEVLQVPVAPTSQIENVLAEVLTVVPPLAPVVFTGWGTPMSLGPPAPDPGTAPSVVSTESILWLRNTSLGSAGTTVAAWPDLSPAARSVTYSTITGNATVADPSTPKGGKSVAFTGGTGGPYFTIGASALPTNRDGEVWMVLKSNDTGGNGSSKWGGDSGQMNHYAYSGSVYDDAGCTSRQNEPGTGIDSWHIRRVKTSGTAREVQRNGVQTHTATVTPFWRQSPVVGGNGAASYMFNGNIAEVIQFGRVLTAPEAAEVLAYLQGLHL